MNQRALRLRRIVASGIAGLSLILTSVIATPTPAQASVIGFTPGNIIADSLFYDGNAMSVTEVQAFLYQRVPRCTIGDPGREAGKAWGNTVISNMCLRDYAMSTVTRSANAYCGAYIGQPSESAAQIIVKVAQACGISPRVLLIVLEKEQSLVTDSWPTKRQIDIATGYACPDSGPNGSANCNPEYYGFQNQVYYAAWQFKVYRAFPNSYNYRPFQTNTIQYNPNPLCGSSQVYIENWATAALYVYTPYVPNAAALAAGWGTGDACSAYGNRNFYNLYTAWFGSIRGFSVSGDIGAYWNNRGGSNSIYGHPTGSSTFYTTRYTGGLWLQSFAGGIIVTEMATGKTVGIPFSNVYSFYNGHAGGIYGPLGAPLSEPSSYSVNGGGTLQWFQGGLVVTAVSSGTTVSVEYGPVYNLYNDVAEGIYGPLGYPISVDTQYTGGKLQSFQGGVVAQATNQTSPVFVSGPIYTAYNTSDIGGIYGRLGFPISNETLFSDGSGWQEFQKGYLLRSSGGAVTEISGVLVQPYRAAERNGNPLGGVIGEKRELAIDGGGSFIQFTNGVIVSERKTGTSSSISGRVFAHYNGVLGGFFGPYGLPVGDENRYVISGGGTVQAFRNGLLFTTGDTVSAMRYSSSIYTRYNGVEGGIYGRLGFPIGDETVSADGSIIQRFQNGVISVSVNGTVTTLPAAAFDLYQAAGAGSGPLGAQTSQTVHYAVGSGATLSFFRGGLITVEDRTGQAGLLVFGHPLYEYYNGRSGGIYGALGYPIGAVSSDASGALVQSFQYGVLRQSPGAAVFTFIESTLQKYLISGAEGGPLGAVIDDCFPYTVNGGGTVQFFQNGLIITEQRTGKTSMLLEGPIYDFYNSLDGIYGTLGFPLADQITVDTITSQQFQNGTLTFANGRVIRS